MWIDRLERNGLSVVALDSRHVELRRGSKSAIFRLVAFDRRVHPRDIGGPPEPDSLLVAPVLSDAAAAVAREREWSVVSDEGPGWVRFHGETLAFDTDEDVQPRGLRRRQRGRPGYGIYTVVRALLALNGASQAELARLAGVTQPRVSQALDQLRTGGLVVKGGHGWVVTDAEEAIDWWAARYPGPGGLRTQWFGLDTVIQQAYRAYEFMNEEGAHPVISGDVAADAVSPWRTPRHALLYAERGADLARIGFTPASPQEATLTVVLPDDPAVWPVGGATPLIELPGMGGIARAGALQVLWDLRGGVGPDANEAAQAWLHWMLQDTMIV